MGLRHASLPARVVLQHPWPGARTVHSIMTAVLVCCQPLRSDAHRRDSAAARLSPTLSPAHSQHTPGLRLGSPGTALVPAQQVSREQADGLAQAGKQEDTGIGMGTGTPLVGPLAPGCAPQDFCPPALHLSMGRAASRLSVGLAKVREIIQYDSSVCAT